MSARSPEDADPIRTDLTVVPDLFRAHVAVLRENGYTTITLDQLDAALLYGDPLPPRPVVLTFDDGYIDHYEQVFPMLQAAEMVGTFFVITGFADANRSGYLTWDQINRMASAGMRMESHTKTHQDLRNREHDFLVYEMLGSLQSLAAHTGRAPLMFAYPAGRYDAMTLVVLEQLPVSRAVTTQPGMLHTTDNRLEMTRIRVHGGTSAAGLMALVRGG